MKFLAAFLEIPSWDGGMSRKAKSFLDALCAAGHTAEFPEGASTDGALEVLGQMSLLDENAAGIARLRDIIYQMSPVRFTGRLFI
jgi:hypothetical protein